MNIFVYIIYSHFLVEAINHTGSAHQNKVLGAWKFVKEDFQKRHPLLPWFLVNRAMKTRLVIKESEFIQYKDEDRILSGPWDLRLKEKLEGKKWVFEKNKEGELKEFSIYLEDGSYFYSDEKVLYKIERDDDFNPNGGKK